MMLTPAPRGIRGGDAKMTNHPNRSRKQKFHAQRLDTFPNMELFVLTEAWADLPAGTKVSAFSCGQDNLRNEHRRTVVVQSGPRKGEKVDGPF
jgi:hypothetical protein